MVPCSCWHGVNHAIEVANIMSIEYIKQIREQEEHAGKIRHDGLMESKRIFHAATDEAAALVDKAQTEARALYKDALAKANEEAASDYDKIISHVRWECEMLLSSAEKKMDKAVAVIVNKVLD